MGIIIPTDYFSEGLKPPTSYCTIFCLLSLIVPESHQCSGNSFKGTGTKNGGLEINDQLGNAVPVNYVGL